MEIKSFRNIEDSIKYIRENNPKREFEQTFDLIVNIRNIDLKKTENKFSKDVILPHGRGKNVEVGIISDTIQEAPIKKADIEKMAVDKKEMKNLMRKYEFFVCEAPLMPLVGKTLGKFLGPKGKMPKLLPPGPNYKNIVDETKKSVRVKLRDSPTIQTCVGSENMKDLEIKENLEKVVEEIKKSIPPKSQIKNVYLKLTMGSPVKLEV